MSGPSEDAGLEADLLTVCSEQLSAVEVMVLGAQLCAAVRGEHRHGGTPRSQLHTFRFMPGRCFGSKACAYGREGLQIECRRSSGSGASAVMPTEQGLSHVGTEQPSLTDSGRHGCQSPTRYVKWKCYPSARPGKLCRRCINDNPASASNKNASDYPPYLNCVLYASNACHE